MKPFIIVISLLSLLIGCDKKVEEKDISFTIVDSGAFYEAAFPFKHPDVGRFEVNKVGDNTRVRIEIAANLKSVTNVKNINNETIITIQYEQKISAIPETYISFIEIEIEGLQQNVLIEGQDGHTIQKVTGEF